MIKIQNVIPTPLLQFGRLWSNVSTLITNLYNFYLGKIKGLRVLYDSGETPILDEVSYMFGVYKSEYDTARDAKAKLMNATFLHQRVNNFDGVWKPIIDGLLGGNSSIYRGLQYYGSFVVGQSIIGSPSKLGFVSFASGVVLDKLSGEIFIDLDVSPTAIQIEELIDRLRPLATIYFNIYCGTTTIVDSAYFKIGLSSVGGIDLIGVDSDPSTVFEVKFIL